VVINVQRRAFLMRWKGAPEFEDVLSIVAAPQDLEDLASMSVFQSQAKLKL
jgi:hypothetical protein